MSPPISSRFSRCPVDKSSSTRTRAPLAASAEAICEPINPAPPVTRAVPVSGIVYLPFTWRLPAHAHILETEFAHVFRFVDVSQISDFGSVHQVAYSGQIECAKLVPLRNEDECVCALDRGILVISIGNLGQQLHSFRFGN